jgi:signal peptidase I
MTLGPVRSGDTIWIDRAAYWMRSPGRDDLVAIQSPGDSLRVKRVVGIPGDVVSIDGDGIVSVDGHPWRPPASRFAPCIRNASQADSVPPVRGFEVYESHFQSSPDPRLIRHAETLVYHHQDIYNRLLPDRIRDDDPANTTIRRRLRPVDHWFLHLRLRSETAGRLHLATAFPGRTIVGSLQLKSGLQTICLEVDRNGWWNRSQRPIQSSEDVLAGSAARGSLVDRVSLTRPLAITWETSGEVRWEYFWLGRAVRYDPPDNLADRWRAGVVVPAGKIFVLGDNATNSEDSRVDPSGVDIDAVIGRVIP